MAEITKAMVLDIITVLLEHGCTPAQDDAAIKATTALVADLVDAFEGRAPGPGSTPDPLLSAARVHFAPVLTAGGTPSLRAIQQELKVGHPRAKRIRGALAAGEQQGERS